MSKNTKYYSYPTIRKVRRKMRRACQMVTNHHNKGIKSYCLLLKDDKGRNIVKAQRIKNRIKYKDQ